MFNVLFGSIDQLGTGISQSEGTRAVSPALNLVLWFPAGKPKESVFSCTFPRANIHAEGHILALSFCIRHRLRSELYWLSME